MMWFIPKNKRAILPLTAGLTLSLGCFLAGCKEKEEVSSEKPAVVVQRIEQTPQTTKVTDAQKTAPAPESAAAPAVTEKMPAKPVTEAPKAEAPAPSIVESSPAKGPESGEGRVVVPQPEAAQSQKAAASETPAGAGTSAETPEEIEPISLASSLLDETFPKYDPTGKVDPFTALFSEETEVDLAEDSTPKRPLTPLEKINISQLKLVAILLAESGNRAMVEDVTGKPYILVSGTYIGVNSGTVSKILKDRVVIEEKTKDFLGRESANTRELKLQKPFGEE
jgi:type IV pilus assembly protein PilP